MARSRVRPREAHAECSGEDTEEDNRAERGKSRDETGDEQDPEPELGSDQRTADDRGEPGGHEPVLAHSFEELTRRLGLLDARKQTDSAEARAEHEVGDCSCQRLSPSIAASDLASSRRLFQGSADYPRAMAMLDRTIVRVLPAMPRSLVRRISDRYIAGTTIADAVRVVRELNAQGKMATIDVLGEEATGRRETLDLVRAYHDVFEAIERERLDSNVSVKLTALGLNLAYELCRVNLFKVVSHAAESGNFVRIDMEDSTTTSDTLELYRELRAEGHSNVGIVLQAYLRRTIRDIHALAPLLPNVRLCKGIYVEPPLIAYREHEEVQRNFVDSLHELLQAGSYVAIATA